MAIKPMIRNNICINSHPEGCRLYTRAWIDWVKKQPRFAGPRKVLVIGGSTGYGLATRIAAAFGAGAATMSVAFEKEPSDKRPGTVGWYNTEEFEAQAKAAGLVSERLYGDAFSNELKQAVVAKVKQLLGPLDLVVYSLASPARTDPASGILYKSVIKPIGSNYHATSIDPMSGEFREADFPPASAEEIEATIKVMGGEDWKLWIDALKTAGLLAKGAITLAYSYIGPEMTHAVYKDGSIGRAKAQLEDSARDISAGLAALGGAAFVSVNKAVVTRSSAVIPVVPLYLALLFKIMKAKGIHEGCIEQMYRLLSTRLYAGGPVPVDEAGRIRVDDWEMRADVQAEIKAIWNKVNHDNLAQVADLEEYRREYLQLHGFGFPQIDYEKD